MFKPSLPSSTSMVWIALVVGSMSSKVLSENLDGDDCPDCLKVKEPGALGGMQRTAVWYNAHVPGTKEALIKAWVGEQTVNVTGPDMVRTEDLPDDVFKVLYGARGMDREMSNDPEHEAMRVSLTREAREWGIW